MINNLDVKNPLHMHPNDSSSTYSIQFTLLKTKNYRIWAGEMKLALQARNKVAFVDDTCKRESHLLLVMF